MLQNIRSPLAFGGARPDRAFEPLHEMLSVDMLLQSAILCELFAALIAVEDA